MRKIISLILCLIFICPAFSACGKRNIVFKDCNNKIMATMQNSEIATDYNEYATLAFNETVMLISAIEGITATEATEKLNNGSYTVHTYFEPNVHTALETTHTNYSADVNYGAAVTNLKGGLSAIFSGGGGELYAQMKFSPHSSIKPISVYAPAIESGKVNWSTVIEDSPYKQLTDQRGELYDWPRNATGEYSYKPTDIFEAIQKSLNTVAVKVLSIYGVENSIKFLEDNFALMLDYEKNEAAKKGGDEVIGNIALGSLVSGISPLEMSGYYQIFATGGMYTPPHTVSKISVGSKVIYVDSYNEKQVISPQTATIMNKLLQGVIAPSGTGAGAKSDNIAIAGKTGTGDNFEDNWFAGVTPEYSCAVWHSKFGSDNIASEMFSSIIGSITKNKDSKFKVSPDIEQAVFCKESGGLFTTACKDIASGYYVSGSLPENCQRH